MSKLKNHKTVIVSPSGQFYGSEQVLYNHLQATERRFAVYVPKSSPFYNKIIALGKHDVYTFVSLKFLYVKLLFKFIFKRYKTLYINEGGHIKYGKLIAILLPAIKIVVHIRLIEDTSKEHLGKLPKNLVLMSISEFIEQLLKAHYKSIKIYDPIRIENAARHKKVEENGTTHVGIIGRVSSSKGLANYNRFFDYYFNHDNLDRFVFTFFGDVSQNETQALNFVEKHEKSKLTDVVFQGFVNDQERMFSSIDVVLHLNENEPLGRIGLESWAREIPFVCFNSGGCGEINRKLDMQKFSVDFKDSWEAKIVSLLSTYQKQFSNLDRIQVRENLIKHFSVERYVTELEKNF